MDKVCISMSHDLQEEIYFLFILNKCWWFTLTIKDFGEGVLCWPHAGLILAIFLYVTHFGSEVKCEACTVGTSFLTPWRAKTTTVRYYHTCLMYTPVLANTSTSSGCCRLSWLPCPRLKLVLFPHVYTSVGSVMRRKAAQPRHCFM